MARWPVLGFADRLELRTRRIRPSSRLVKGRNTHALKRHDDGGGARVRVRLALPGSPGAGSPVGVETARRRPRTDQARPARPADAKGRGAIPGRVAQAPVPGPPGDPRRGGERAAQRGGGAVPKPAHLGAGQGVERRRSAARAGAAGCLGVVHQAAGCGGAQLPREVQWQGLCGCDLGDVETQRAVRPRSQAQGAGQHGAVVRLGSLPAVPVVLRGAQGEVAQLRAGAGGREEVPGAHR